MRKNEDERIQELMTEGERNLQFLQRLLPSSDQLYIWCYTEDGKLIASTCPNEVLFDTAFAVFGAKAKVLTHIRSGSSPRPILTGSSIGLQWAAAYESFYARPGKMLLFVLGPVFFLRDAKVSTESGWIESQNLDASIAWKRKFIHALSDISVMSLPVFGRYAVMLHNAINDEQIGFDDLFSDELASAKQSASPQARDRSKVYASEQALLQMVRTGNINYQNALRTSANISTGVPVHSKDPLYQSRINIIVFTSLVVRAAIEGGLLPDEAYALGDSYIQAAEESTDSRELIDLANAMYDDFVHRVHRCHANPNYSIQIQKCCDYISLNLNSKITTAELAELVGYSQYYLTEKFKKETGMSLSGYIKCTKIEHARFLLASTNQTIQQIAEALAFNTPNYFIQCFREVVGTTPAQYRKQTCSSDLEG